MTYRESRLRRAEQLQRWADANAERAHQHREAAREINDAIPFGQPILVGHHSERRMRRAYERRDEHMFAWLHLNERAAKQEAAAVTIIEQAERSAYTDDDDALEKLQARLAEAEARRERLKAYNARFRRTGRPDTDGLTPEDVEDLRMTIRYGQSNGEFPSYVFSNISSQIQRLKKRIQEVAAYQQQAAAASSSASGCTIARTDDGRLRLTFTEKPRRDVIDALKAARWMWYQRSWWGSPGTLPAAVAEAYGITEPTA